jgi:hypothetical protein
MPLAIIRPGRRSELMIPEPGDLPGRLTQPTVDRKVSASSLTVHAILEFACISMAHPAFLRRDALF